MSLLRRALDSEIGKSVVLIRYIFWPIAAARYLCKTMIFNCNSDVNEIFFTVFSPLNAIKRKDCINLFIEIACSCIHVTFIFVSFTSTICVQNNLEFYHSYSWYRTFLIIFPPVFDRNSKVGSPEELFFLTVIWYFPSNIFPVYPCWP